MTELVVKDLRASVPGKAILRGIDVTVSSGEVHVIMGPNGSGKSTLSHVLMGGPGYRDISGSVTLDGVDLLELTPAERAAAGLFLGMQYPMEVPGVRVEDVLREALRATGGSLEGLSEQMAREAEQIRLAPDLLERPMNVELSGGERKRNETLQLAILRPKIAILDELDSGLDVDALRDVSRRVEALTSEGLGVLAITHYNRLLEELRADVIHVMVAGKIVASGGPELAEELEQTGYAAYGGEEESGEFANAPLAKHERPEIIDMWGGDPLAAKGMK